MNGLGSARCIEVLPNRRQCPNLEVEGLEFCLQHMPEDMLEEAEAVTGVKRCRRGEQGPYSCREYAQTGTDHCPAHNPARKQRADLRLVQGQAVDRAGQIIAQYGDDLAHPTPVSDPYGELMEVAGELRTWKDILRKMVQDLEKRYRYTGQAGEQTRAEVVLYNQALKDFAHVLLSIGRLNLDARLVGIRQQTLDMLERALDASLEKAGVPLEAKQEAREVFRANIKVVA